MDCEAVREELKLFTENSTWMIQGHPKPLSPSRLANELKRLDSQLNAVVDRGERE